MLTLKCSACGAKLEYKEGSRVLVCAYCGTEQILEDKDADASGIKNVGNAKGVYYRTYVPFGWDVQVGEDDTCFSFACPMRGVMVMTSPAKDCVICFRGAFLWRHFDPRNPLMQQNQVEMSTMTRYRSYMDAPTYCDDIFNREHPQAQNVIASIYPVPVQRQQQAESYRQAILQKCQSAMRGGFFGQARQPVVQAELFSKAYTFTENGRELCAIVTTFIDAVEMGGGEGGFLGKLIQPQKDWECLYEFTMCCENGAFQKCLTEYQKMDGTVEEGEYLVRRKEELQKFARQKQQETNMYVAQTQAQMAQQRAAASQRMSAIINDKASYINNVQQQMYNNTSATRDRVAAMQSEAIRGVNSYGYSGGVVEASTGFDHVYQSNANPDVFAGSIGGEFNSADFDALNRRY